MPCEPVEKNVGKMKEYLLDAYASSAFNKCPHEPLPMMKCAPIRIHVKEDAKPVACKTASTVPLHLREAVKAQLEEDVAAGAVGIGEISKAFGLYHTKADGSRLQMDDPELDIVWETAGRLGIPVFVHTADPPEFFEPLDYTNERWLELALFENRRFMDRERFPSFDDLMEERNRMLMKHPNTTWILAHMGWHTADLARLGEIFDAHPNVLAEVGAVLYDLGRQPRFAGEFFAKYQERILFGKDSFQPDEYPYFFRVFETADEYFDYYRDYHAFWKLYGMDLPDEVLRALYYENAYRIIPGLPTAALPTGQPE